MAETVTMSVTEMREQIKANGVVLFPSKARDYTSRQHSAGTTGHVLGGSEAFEVVVTRNETGDYEAFLAYSEDILKPAAYGEPDPSVVDALRSLLDVTATAAAEKMAVALEIGGWGGECWASYGGGKVLELDDDEDE
ncbi:hypothetical protein LTR56_004996 [Elasticomyces elasticus]|nr:hypothetical protein LTR22_015811 [Elasticomyces elasticus]KAK3652702.1 hypothetical protein LTR56_004996 [Elasticomyces elasticus]KAK4914632.1 hypothetical protein LTR49_017199 [Elasticomyces elasticus]KAK5753998.1 hypothetical protein LTS12_015964 [Elasticomyces elasticus]